jgi:hypothetical protein
MHVYNGTSVLRLENFPALSKMGWSSTDRSIFASNGTLYFSGFIGAQSRSLWAFNGTDAPVAQTLTSATESHWISPHVYNNSLYIETTNFDEFSSKLYRLNEQNVPVLLPNLENSDFSYISVLSDGLYFWRKTEAEGTKLWKVGTNGVPQKFADTVIEDPWSRSDLLEVNGKIITAFDERMVAIDKSGQISFDQGDAMGVNDLTVVGNYVYFSAWSDADGVGTEIYRWNGTGASELIADVKEGGDGSNTDELISYNSKLYFTAEDGSETANQYYSEARFLFSLTENGTLTKLTEVTCSWDCSTESSIRDLEVVGSTMFAIADSDYGNRQLLKFNNNTNTFSSMKRNGENIVGVGSFGAGNSFTTIGTYVENVGCSVHKINADGSLVDIFNNVTDWCLYGYSWNPVIDFHGNYYFSYFSAQYGEELHMLPGAGTATKPNKVGSLALAKGGAKATSLKMSWKAPVLTGGKAITDYKVEYSLNGKKWTTFKHKASKLTSITITKLKKKTKYFVRVSAINAKGVGISSVVKVATK